MNAYTLCLNKAIIRSIHKAISIVILTAFISTTVKPSAYAQLASVDPMPRMPAPGVMVHLSPEYTPAYLKGIVIHPENALKFDFIINKGDKVLTDAQKKVEYTKLTKYFLASLAIPDDDQWVNLSPYEKDRIIKDDFGKTEMGRDLLAQDYMLKQITASLIYPQDNLGKKFWDRVYAQAQKQYGTSDIPVNTFNKVWILPDDALIYEKGNVAYVLKNHLKVMLEEDYLSLQKHSGITSTVIPAQAGIHNKNNIHTLSSQIIRQIVLPALEREVNEGKNFAALRQVYSGMLLAAWYKRALKESLLSRIYANRSKVKGVDQDPKTNEQIYRQYLKAYKKGVFNFIKEDMDKYTNEMIPRKYFSGGTGDYAMAQQELGRNPIKTTDSAQALEQAQVQIADGQDDYTQVRAAEVNEASVLEKQANNQSMSGALLIIHERNKDRPKPTTSTVELKEGETLKEFARRTYLTVAQVRAANSGRSVVSGISVELKFMPISTVSEDLPLEYRAFGQPTSLIIPYIDPAMTSAASAQEAGARRRYIQGVMRKNAEVIFSNDAMRAVPVEIEQGETLAAIARRAGISVSRLRQVNQGRVFAPAGTMQFLPIEQLSENTPLAGRVGSMPIYLRIPTRGYVQGPANAAMTAMAPHIGKELQLARKVAAREEIIGDNKIWIPAGSQLTVLDQRGDLVKVAVNEIAHTTLGAAYGVKKIEQKQGQVTEAWLPINNDIGTLKEQHVTLGEHEIGSKMVLAHNWRGRDTRIIDRNSDWIPEGSKLIVSETKEIAGNLFVRVKIEELAFVTTGATGGLKKARQGMEVWMPFDTTAFRAESLTTHNFGEKLEVTHNIPARQGAIEEKDSSWIPHGSLITPLMEKRLPNGTVYVEVKVDQLATTPFNVAYGLPKAVSSTAFWIPSDSSLTLGRQSTLAHDVRARREQVTGRDSYFIPSHASLTIIGTEQNGLLRVQVNQMPSHRADVPYQGSYGGRRQVDAGAEVFIPGSYVEPAEKPVASAAKPGYGGIDFNAAHLRLQIKRDGKGVPLPISQQDLENIKIDGLVPIIIDIRPANSVPIFSQLQNSVKTANG